MRKSKLQTDNIENKIPKINREIALIKRLLIVVLGGLDGVLDKKGQLYFRLLCRLVDKSFDEYLMVREYIVEEIKTKDKLAYRFHIISHLENCINAINRAIRVFKSSITKSNIKNFVSESTIKEINRFSVSSIRNRIEHIDEDIYKKEINSGIFLDIDDKYKEICIGGKCISINNLASLINNYHNFVSEIFNNLPNHWENGVFYYDGR